MLIVNASAVRSDADWMAVGEALAKSGTKMPGGVHRFRLPILDLEVKPSGVEIKPTPAPESGFAFQAIGGIEAAQMGG
jgi:hypothetical protein